MSREPCYDKLDGSENTNDWPCIQEGGPSFCCGVGWLCMSNGFCGKDDGLRLIGSCTQKDWNTGKCPDICLNATNSDPAIKQCPGTNYWCCPPTKCCTDIRPNEYSYFLLPNNDPIGEIGSSGLDTATEASTTLAEDWVFSVNSINPISSSATSTPTASDTGSTGSASTQRSRATESIDTSLTGGIISTSKINANLTLETTTLADPEITSDTAAAAAATGDSGTEAAASRGTTNPLAIGLGVGLGLAFLIAVAFMGFWIHRLKQRAQFQLSSITGNDDSSPSTASEKAHELPARLDRPWELDSAEIRRYELGTDRMEIDDNECQEEHQVAEIDGKEMRRQTSRWTNF